MPILDAVRDATLGPVLDWNLRRSLAPIPSLSERRAAEEALEHDQYDVWSGSGETAEIVIEVLADQTGDPVSEFGDSGPGLGQTGPIMGLGGFAPRKPGEVETILRRLGWRIRTTGESRQAVRLFQGAYAGPWGPLEVDGVPGEHTLKALRWSNTRLSKRLPTASQHFSFYEFDCTCGGAFSNCARIWIKRAVIVQAEIVRKEDGRGFTPVSPCRCPGRNRAVGGASRSRHLTGEALDVPPRRSVAWWRANVPGARGLGHNPSGLVRHFDVRPTRTTWRYGS